MKTRIVKTRGRFWPEYRFCFIWFKFTEGRYHLSFPTLAKCELYIDVEMNNSRISPKEIIPYKTFCKRTDYTGPK